MITRSLKFPRRKILSRRQKPQRQLQLPPSCTCLKINHINAHANVNSWPPAHWQVSARVIRTNIHNVKDRSSVRPRFVGVKMRLIALRHQSLARAEKSRNWTAFSKLNRVGK